MTLTMTHSDEVTNGSQKPGPTDVSAGVMTPHNKNLWSLYALLSRQGGLLVLCIMQCTESRVWKKTNWRMLRQTHPNSKRSPGTRRLNPRIHSVDNREQQSPGKVWQTFLPMWFTLISPKRLQFLERPSALMCIYWFSCLGLQAKPT